MRKLQQKIALALKTASYTRDRAVRQYALIVWDTLQQYVRKRENSLDPIQRGTGKDKTHGFIVRSPDAGLPRGLSVLFLTEDPDGVAGGSYNIEPKLGHVISIYGILHSSGEASGLAAKMDFKSFRNTFVHEFVHFIDQLRYKGEGRIGRDAVEAIRRDDFGKYTRTPAEFNAHYQEVAGIIENWVLERVDYYKEASPEMKKKFKRTMQKTFSSFKAFRTAFGKIEPVEDVESAIKGTKWEKKWVRRLYGLFVNLRGQVAEYMGEKSR